MRGVAVTVPRHLSRSREHGDQFNFDKELERPLRETIKAIQTK